MAILTRQILKGLWKTGYRPNQIDYNNLFDSVLLHEDYINYDKLPVLAQGSFIGNNAGMGSVPQELTLETVKTMLGVTGGGSSVSGSVNYTNTTPVPQALGGIPVGMTFDNNSIQQILDTLLYPFQTPSFSAFALTGVSSPVEVGMTYTGNKVATWNITNSTNVTDNTLSISCQTNGTLTSNASITSPLSIAVGTIQKTTATSNTWTIHATDTQSTSFTRAFTVNWQWRRYWGDYASSSISDVTLLSSNSLGSGYAGTYTFSNATPTYKYFCWPTAFGTPTSFKLGGFDVAMEAPVTLSVTNSYFVTTNYNIFRTTNQLSNVSIIVA
jgi:hypothetical protein